MCASTRARCTSSNDVLCGTQNLCVVTTRATARVTTRQRPPSRDAVNALDVNRRVDATSALNARAHQRDARVRRASSRRPTRDERLTINFIHLLVTSFIDVAHE